MYMWIMLFDALQYENVFNHLKQSTLWKNVNKSH